MKIGAARLVSEKAALTRIGWVRNRLATFFMVCE
jgi:hypothetical protein